MTRKNADTGAQLLREAGISFGQFRALSDNKYRLIVWVRSCPVTFSRLRDVRAFVATN